MDHFNGLRPAQAERLAMLAEECAEVIQVVGKILRHGYDSYHPDDAERRPNRQLLEKELVDVAAVKLAMESHGDIDPSLISLSDVWRKKLRFTHHQGSY